MRSSGISLLALVAAAACNQEPMSPPTSSAPLEAQMSAAVSIQSALTALSGQGAGLVKVATTADDVAGPGTFDVQGTVNVHGTSPETAFTVLRRVDLNPDGICTGASWLMLPPPNAPSFTTSQGGAGALHFRISRGAPFLDGVRFDVQWRLTGTDGTMLESECFTVTVR